jgi:ribosomal protein S18 acetylase RimI-like enzyme
MTFQIRQATKDDILQILAMLQEFAGFLNLSKYCEVTEESLQNVMFGENSFVKGLIAFADEIPIAYAIFFPYFASFKGHRSIFLEDIYIKPEFRNAGLGEKMLREIAKIAKSQNCNRIDFQVLQDNKNAINFYKKLGAISNEDETHFKFADEAFQNLAS